MQAKWYALTATLLMLSGCDIYGLPAGGGVVVPPPGEGEAQLTTITFETATGFPQDNTDLTFDVDGLSVRFSGGFATTRGIPALYGEGLRAWMINASQAPGAINLEGLGVLKVRAYWVHRSGMTPAMLTWTDSAGTTSVPLESFGATSLGQAAGFVTLEAAEGTTITRIDLAYPEGTPDNEEASLDTVTLTVGA